MITFAVALHGALGLGGNVCWSPFAVARALHRLAADARGLTRDELVTALLGDKAADLAELGAVLTRAAELPDLAVSDTLWADPSVSTRARPAPFLTAPGTARDLINAEVAATTRGLVPELIDVLPADAVSALVVAIYLRCGWVEEFDPAETRPRRFRTPDGKKQVPTMRLVSAELGYAATEAWQVVALPAHGGVRAVVLLPYGDLARFEPELTAGTLADLLAAPRLRHVDLRLPSFAVRTRTELTGALERLGVRTAFTTDAELGAGLALDTVPHESVLTVDERGIEGAAAVAAIAWMSGTAEPPVEVAVDRPFLFAVVHEGTGVPYFLARITDPVTS
ncbi:serpin family protein [Actinophytocola algeriensis]|uniref:Serpin B n=1 Tax=Actinophytocola algeriensis TaxID=1768010 RepID=A0A7W7VFE0_9PSEU|nr:serpin family protein [Actinophytocola algeriensis]MBB4908217.1 serpin B [Actinophytocola algeriensis]MBE1480247.1 serpin B [Actinophytocola algeriensis]